MQIPFFPEKQSPPIILSLYDYDVIGKDFLGSVVVNVQDGIKEGWIMYNKPQLPEPKWVDLKYGESFLFGFNNLSFVGSDRQQDQKRKDSGLIQLLRIPAHAEPSSLLP